MNETERLLAKAERYYKVAVVFAVISLVAQIVAIIARHAGR